MTDKQNVMEIDLIDLINYLRKKMWLIVIVCILCAAIGYGGTKLFIEPEYIASTRVYVLNRSNENMVVYSDYQISTQMLRDYQVLITGRNVTKEVVETLNLDMETTELAKMITVTAPEDTRFVQISVTDTDPERAAQIANMVRQIASVQIRNLMDVDAVNLVYEAEVPQKPSSPNTMKNTVLAAAFGMVGVLAVLVIIYILDDSISTEEDVKRHLNLSVLGVIPMAKELGEDESKKKSGRKKRVGLAERKK